MKRSMVLFLTAALLISYSSGLILQSPRAFAQSDFSVTEAYFYVADAKLSGKCPVKVVFNGKITTNGPGRVEYTFLRSDGATAPVYSLDFKAAGTQSFAADWTLGDASALPFYEGWQKLRILSPRVLETPAEDGRFTISCGNGSPEDKQPDGKAWGNEVDPKTAAAGKETVSAQMPGGKPGLPKPGPPDCITLPGGCPPESAFFRITINGFRCNRRTDDKFLDEDGAKDEVFIRTDASLFDRSVHRNLPMRQSRVFGDSNTRPERIRAGRATSIGGGNGGFEEGDTFPSNPTPWLRIGPPTTDRPPLLAWEGQLTRDNNALALIPSFWESDINSRLVNIEWTSSVAAAFAGIGPEMNLAISRRSGSEPTSVMQSVLSRFFDPVRVPGAGDNDRDRPIGMEDRGSHYGYRPQMLVLTYDAAERISQMDSGFGPGIIPLAFKDNGGMKGDYTVFLQVEKLVQNPDGCAADLRTAFNGTGTMATSHPDAQGPFSQNISLGVNLANCRATLSISQFPPISVSFKTPIGSNTTTLTLMSGGSGPFSSATGRIDIPLQLGLANTIGLAGMSRIDLTLSTENPGGSRYSMGSATLTGSGIFRGGFLDGHTGNFTVTGTFSPAP